MNDNYHGVQPWDFCEEGEKPMYRLMDALDRNDLKELVRLVGLHPELLDGFAYDGGNGVTNPIAYAAYGGQEEIVRWLLAAGAKPDIVEGSGRTALEEVTLQAQRSGNLYESSRAGYFRVMRLLVDAGADPHVAQDGFGPDASFRMIHGVGLLDALAELERRHGPG